MSHSEPTLRDGYEADIVRRPEQQLGTPLPSDDEIRRLYRIAEAFAQSGVYKDARQAGQAFAKLMAGRDLGLSPARAMSGLHFVEGQVQMHYRTLGAFVRANGYHYTFPEAPTNESVSIDFYAPEDGGGERELLGRSTFTMADADLAGIKRGNYVKYPRNMLIARAMSNGVGWYCPEVLGGIPVYVEGEIPAPADVTVGQGDGKPQGLELGPKVEAILARAAKVGHAGLADRATVEMAVGGRSPGVVNEWAEQATAALNKLESDRQHAETIPDAEVVDDTAAQTPPQGAGDDAEPQANPQPHSAVRLSSEARDARLKELASSDEDPSLTLAQHEMIMEEIAWLENQR